MRYLIFLRKFLQPSWLVKIGAPIHSIINHALEYPRHQTFCLPCQLVGTRIFYSKKLIGEEKREPKLWSESYTSFPAVPSPSMVTSYEKMRYTPLCTQCRDTALQLAPGTQNSVILVIPVGSKGFEVSLHGRGKNEIKFLIYTRLFFFSLFLWQHPVANRCE